MEMLNSTKISLRFFILTLYFGNHLVRMDKRYEISINRLNSGIKNRLNFLAWAIYIFQKVVSDSVNHADSEDIKILIQFPGKSIFENFAQFLKKRGRHQYAWVFDSQNHSGCSTFYADQFHIQNKGYSFDFMSTHAISTPVKSIFWLVFWP